jgi:hypothetical protein
MLDMKRGSCALLLLTTALISPAALAQPKYPATVDLFGGVDGDGPGGGLELVAPFAEGEGSLFFGLARGTMWDETGVGGVGLGYRTQALPGWILGGYGMLDYQRGQSNEGYFQGVLGLEALTESFDLRLNGYLPEDDETTLADIGGAAPPPPPVTIGDLAIIDHEIGLVTGVTAGTAGLYRAFERPLPGIDVEIGYRLPLPGHDFRIFLGAFHFDDEDYESVTGPKARAEWRLHDLDLFGNNSRLTLEAGVRDDDVRGTDASAGVRIRIPFGGVPSNQRGHELAGLDQRMLDPIRREDHIVTGEREESQAGTPSTVELEAVEAVETGNEITSIWFADGAGGGDGTMGNETNLAGAVAGAGVGGLVVALGGSGDLASNVFLADDQILLGGASTLDVMGLTSGTMVTYAPGGARPTIVDQSGGVNPIITLANGNLLAGFDAQNTTRNILGAGIDGLIARSIGTVGGSGILLNNSSNVSIADFAYLGTGPVAGGAGVTLMNSTNATLDGIDVENAGTGVLIFNSQGVDVLDLMSVDNGAGFNVVSSSDIEIGQVAASYALTPVAGNPHGGIVRDSTNVQVNGLSAAGMRTGLLITGSTGVDAGNIAVTNAEILGIQIQSSTDILLHDFSVSDGAGLGLQIIDGSTTGRVITVMNGSLSNVGSGSQGAVMVASTTGNVSGGSTGITLSNLSISGARGLTPALAKGISLSAAHGVTLQNVSINGSDFMGGSVTTNGIEIAGSTGISASSLSISDVLGNGMLVQNSSDVTVSSFSIFRSGGTGLFVVGGTGNAFSQGSILEAVASSTAGGAGGIFLRAQNTAPTQASFSNVTIKGASSTTPGLAQGVGVFNSIPGASINTTFNGVSVDADTLGGSTVTSTGFRISGTPGTVTISGTGNNSTAATDCSISGAAGTIEIDSVTHSDASC